MKRIDSDGESEAWNRTASEERKVRVRAERPRGSQSHLRILIGRPSLSPSVSRVFLGPSNA